MESVALEAKKIANKEGYFLVGQHFNPANPEAHVETANEIWEDFGDTLGAVICTTGTGGSITGIGRALREKHPTLRMIATEPADSPIQSQGIGRPHKIMGTAPAFIPDNLDTSIYDEVIPITTQEAYEMTQLLAEREGSFAGISSGAAVVGMLKVAKQNQMDGTTLLAILPDTGERYLSTDVWNKN